MRWIVVLIAAMGVAFAGEAQACDATCQAQATAALNSSRAEFQSVPTDEANWETYFAAGMDYMEDAWAAGLDGQAGDDLGYCYGYAGMGLQWGDPDFWEYADSCLEYVLGEIGQ